MSAHGVDPCAAWDGRRDTGNLPAGIGETANGETCATLRNFFRRFRAHIDKATARTKNGLADGLKFWT